MACGPAPGVVADPHAPTSNVIEIRRLGIVISKFIVVSSCACCIDHQRLQSAGHRS